MKKIKWLSLVVLAFSIVAFARYNWTVLKNKDVTGPIIRMEEEQIYVSVDDKDKALLQGMTAVDAKDGDVTDSLVVESISGFVEENKRYVNYAAFDSDNHVTKVSRKMTYTDYKPIHFSLEESLRFPSTSYGSMDILGNVRAQDCLDGDISDRIKFSTDSSVYLYAVGEYDVTLEVTNSAGDTAQLPVTITIYDNTRQNMIPKINLSKYLVYTKKGTPLNPLSYLDTIIYQGTEYAVTEERGTFCVDTSGMSWEELKTFQEEQKENPSVSKEKFIVQDNIDYQIPGVYEIKYSLMDDDENIGNVNLVVVVEEV